MKKHSDDIGLIQKFIYVYAYTHTHTHMYDKWYMTGEITWH